MSHALADAEFRLTTAMAASMPTAKTAVMPAATASKSAHDPIHRHPNPFEHRIVRDKVETPTRDALRDGLRDGRDDALGLVPKRLRSHYKTSVPSRRREGWVYVRIIGSSTSVPATVRFRWTAAHVWMAINESGLISLISCVLLYH